MLAGDPRVRALVLDTNVVLDAFVFNDPATQALQGALAQGGVHWLTTGPMRDELERVLAYPNIAARLVRSSLSADAVLARFDAGTQLMEAAPKAAVTCRDADDQKFIDLAVAHQAVLLSRDHAVLCMARRLAPLGVRAQAGFEAGLLALLLA